MTWLPGIWFKILQQRKMIIKVGEICKNDRMPLTDEAEWWLLGAVLYFSLHLYTAYI